MKLTDIILQESKIAIAINSAIDKIDPNLGYKDFAQGVAEVVRNEYGSHLVGLFMEELHKHLGLDEIAEENSSPKINITSVEQTGKLYSISIDGVKQREEDEVKAIEMIKSITGIVLSHGSRFDENEVISALRNAGYDAEHSEIDVS
jgi:hypothetical protein